MRSAKQGYPLWPLAVLSMADAAPLARQRLIRQGALNQPLGLVTTTLAGPSGHHGHLVSAATAAFREPPSTVAATTSGSSTATASVATATASVATATASVATATATVATATTAAAPSEGHRAPACSQPVGASDIHRLQQLRACFSSVAGPNPLDADSLDLALFAVGWEPLLRDLRLGLGPRVSSTVEAALVGAGVRDAFVLRNNLVAYKKVLLGIYKSNLALAHDLRRLATFFREPPATFADCDEGGGDGGGGGGGGDGRSGDGSSDGGGTDGGGSRDGGGADGGRNNGRGGDGDLSSRAFFRPSRYRQLSDALCKTEGAVGGVLDGRRFTKAICCVPRHPDAPRSSARPYGQPFAHYRCAGLLSEPLPGALKCWRLLREASAAFGDGASSGDESAGESFGRRVQAVLAASEAAILALPVEAHSGWEPLLVRLSEELVWAGTCSQAELWFVRCVLIARGGAKALAVSAEALRLAALMRAVLDACVKCEAILLEADGAIVPRTTWASDLQRRADATPAASAAAASPAAAVAQATTIAAPPVPAAPAAPLLGDGGDGVGSGGREGGGGLSDGGGGSGFSDGGGGGGSGRLGHPQIRGWVFARKSVCTLDGLRASLSSTLHWLTMIAMHNPDAKVLFVRAEAKLTLG